MHNLSSLEFNVLCNQDEIKTIKRMKDKRPRILETKDGNIIKILHARNKFFSTFKNKKSAKNFCINAMKLVKYEISAPMVHDYFHCADLKNCVIIYKKLKGDSVRVIANQNPDMLANIAVLLAELHQKGIFFRSIHIDNILRQADGRFALIDIAGVYFKKSPLNVFLRYRNLRHMFSIKQDKVLWKAFGLQKFLQLYFQYASLSHVSEWLIAKLISRI